MLEAPGEMKRQRITDPKGLANNLFACSFLVKAWNYSSWPAYKSKLWNKQEEQPQVQHRNPYVARRSVALHSMWF